MHVIDTLAQFVAHQPEGALPSTVKEACSILTLDLIGAAAAGAHSDLAIAARQAGAALYGSGPATVWFGQRGRSVANAAVANAAAASALDIDDGHRGAAGHPGAAIFPTVFALGEALNASDAQIFDAIALGYDVGLRIAASRPTETIETYASGRWGSYGAAAAAGRLLGLDARQMAQALAIAGAETPICFPKGTSAYQGSTVKEVIPPAVHCGLTAAYRAKAGGTGPRDLLDREDRFDRQILFGELGERWWIEDCYLKPYACCRYMHAAIDAIVTLRRPEAQVRSLRIETFPRALGLVNERRPRTLEGAQYSFYFSCALAAIYGAAALQPIDLTCLQDAEILSLADRIELTAADDFDDSFPVSTPCRVFLDQGLGQEVLTVLKPTGDAGNPMQPEQVVEKFRRISALALDAELQEIIISRARGVAEDGFRPLFEVMRRTALPE